MLLSKIKEPQSYLRFCQRNENAYFHLKYSSSQQVTVIHMFCVFPEIKFKHTLISSANIPFLISHCAHLIISNLNTLRLYILLFSFNDIIIQFCNKFEKVFLHLFHFIESCYLFSVIFIY